MIKLLFTPCCGPVYTPSFHSTEDFDFFSFTEDFDFFSFTEDFDFFSFTEDFDFFSFTEDFEKNLPEKDSRGNKTN